MLKVPKTSPSLHSGHDYIEVHFNIFVILCHFLEVFQACLWLSLSGVASKSYAEEVIICIIGCVHRL